MQAYDTFSPGCDQFEFQPLEDPAEGGDTGSSTTKAAKTHILADDYAKPRI